MVSESREVEIDGVTYELRPWGYADAEKWAKRLLVLVAEIGNTGTPSVAALVGGITDTMWAEFCALCRKYTFVIDNSGGERKRLHLEKIAEQHLRGRLTTMVDLVKEHLTSEFIPFFTRALAALATAPAPPAEEKT